MKKIILSISLTLFSLIMVAQRELSAEDYLIAGISQSEIGNHVRACEYYTKAIALNPSYAEAFLNRGTSKALTGDDYGALADFDKAIEFHPHYGMAYLKMGLIDYKLGNKPLACAHWKMGWQNGNSDAQNYCIKYCDTDASSSGSGSVSFYASKKWGKIDLYFDGRYLGAFTNYFAAKPPICGQVGTLSMTYRPGTYRYTATSAGFLSTKSWEGTVTITNGGCVLVGPFK